MVLCGDVDDRRLICNAMLEDAECLSRSDCYDLSAIGSVAEEGWSGSVCESLAWYCILTQINLNTRAGRPRSLVAIVVWLL